MIHAIIFDLDGVLVDTAHYHFLAWKRLADELGIPLTLQDNERLKGVSRMESLRIILEIGNKQLSEREMIEMAEKKNEWFVEYINEMKPTEIFPGVKDLLARLKSEGYKIALASSSKNARQVIGILGIEPTFDAIVDGMMITHTKPDPEIFLTAAKLLNIHPSTCLVVEDAEAGVAAALSAGMQCIGIGLPAQLAKAHQVFSTIGELKVEHLSKIDAES